MLVGRALDVGGDAPVVDQARVGEAPVDVGVDRLEVVEADHGLGVADVEGEEHGVRRYEGSGRGVEPEAASADVEADVEGGGRLGDLAGAEQVDAAGGVGAGRLDGDAAAALEQRAARRRWPRPSRRPGRRRPWPPRASCCRAAPRRRRPRAPGRAASRSVASTCTSRPGQVALADATASAMPSTARWLSLNITQSDRLPRWFTAAAGPHRRLLQRAQARASSCGCPRSGPTRRTRRRRRTAG